MRAIAIKANNPSMSMSEAARRAGYTPATAQNAKINIFSKPLVQTWLDDYKYTLNKYDINPTRLAIVLDELLDDKEARIRLDTVKTLHEVFGVKTERTEGLKRRMTLEEFEEKEGIK